MDAAAFASVVAVGNISDNDELLAIGVASGKKERVECQSALPQ